MGTFRNIMIILGMLFSALVIFFAVGMCFSGFRQKVNNVFHVVPESSYNTTLEQYEQQSVILTTLQSEKISLETEKENLQTDKASLQTEKESLQTEKSNLQIQLARLQQSFDANEIEILNLESEIANLELDITNLETEIIDYEYQIINLETEIINYETEIADLNNEIVMLQNNLTNISANVNGAIFTYRGQSARIIVAEAFDNNILYSFEGKCGSATRYYGQDFVNIWNNQYKTVLDLIQFNIANPTSNFYIDKFDEYNLMFNGSNTTLNFNCIHYNFNENADYNFHFLLNGNIVDINDVATSVNLFAHYDVIINIDINLDNFNKITNLDILFSLDEVV